MALSEARQRKRAAIAGTLPREQPRAVSGISGSDRPPPGSMELPLAAPERLWVALRLPDAALLETVAARCYRFTSLVSLEPPDGILLEAQGSLRLFGGRDRLVALIGADLKEQGIEAQLATAPTPMAALWLSRRESQREGPLSHNLSSLPLACLRWPQEPMKLLDALGLCTVGELMRLPRGGLARRLGAEWLEALDRALGHRADPRRHFLPPQRYEAAFGIEIPIDTTAALEALLVSHLDGLQDFLRGRQAAIGVLDFRLRHRKRAATRLRLALAAPCGQIEPLRHLLHERLSALALPAPVIGVRVRSGSLFAAGPASGSLLRKLDMQSQGDATALPRLVERLRARLGVEAAFGIRPRADHRPEKACAIVDALEKAPGVPPPASSFVRPAWLCSPAQPVPEAARSRWLPECGPERIETGWWDGEDAARDYFIVRDANGARLWVYRERSRPHRWYLHGLLG